MIAEMPAPLMAGLWAAVAYSALVAIRALYDAVKATKDLARAASKASERIAEANAEVNSEQVQLKQRLDGLSKRVSSEEP